MSRIGIVSLAAILAGAIGAPALAADYVEPPVVEAPPIQQEVVYDEPSYGGWYIRGDIDYHASKFRGADYVLYGAPGQMGKFDSGKLKGAFSLGAGVGYQVNKYFRTDITGDYLFKSDFRGSTSGFCNGNPCVSSDTSSYTAILLLANAYADLGTYHGITPYVGVGIGGAHVKWNDLINTDDNGTFRHEGGKGWRFAYAAMAGASYCVTANTKLDVGYRYSRIEGGRMFGYAVGAGPGYDRGIDTHEVRGGLRYQFGKSDCSEPEPIAYEPEPAPVYKQ